MTDDNFNTLVVNEVEINVVSLSLPFSDYKEIDQLEEYAHIAGVDDNLELPPVFVIPNDSMIPQNGAQLVASREVFQNAMSKKRKRDEVEIAHRAG